jgi:uncharacterized membrane protein YbhN (UPF0104 family)
MKLTVFQHLAALALVAADMAFRGLRIQQLLPVGLGRAIAVNTVGDALAAVTPARLGGEPLRFVAFQRAGATGAAVLAAFATEVCIDAVLLGVVTLWLGVSFAGAARALLARVAGLAGSPLAFWGVVAVVGLAALSISMAVRPRRRLRAALVQGFRHAWRIALTRRRRTLMSVTWLTVLSMAARTAVLPVLAAGTPGLSLGGLVAGSFALLFSQVVLPTPSGLGGVELGFLAGFAGSLAVGDAAQLLVVWRVYTLVLGSVAGAVLLGWAGWNRPTQYALRVTPHTEDLAAP